MDELIKSECERCEGTGCLEWDIEEEGHIPCPDCCEHDWNSVNGITTCLICIENFDDL